MSLLKNLFENYSKNKENTDAVFNRLVERYTEPHRFYHTLKHIEDGLTTYHQMFPTMGLPTLEFFAWMYHDAVYDTKRSDNEEMSAAVFMREAPELGFSMDEVDRITQLILATDPSAEPLSVINDMDLSGLGSAPEVFNTNTDNIRKEYDWVSEEVWRKGRVAILRQFLQRPQLYITEPFREKFTNQAIENIKHALVKLSQ